MSFSSLAFFIFFIILFFLFWRINKKNQWKLLLLASSYFYLSWKPAYGLVLLFSILISYVSAKEIEKSKDNKKLILFISLFLQLSILGLFKYFNFFSITLNNLLQNFSISLDLINFQLLLPLGISFFTFQTIGYLVDVYRGTIKAEKILGKYALFVSFFPLISAGPIERAGHLLPQFDKKKTFKYKQVVSGLQLFILGLFKKVVIADNLSIIVNTVFTSLSNYKGLSLVITIFLFSWQIYYDFSGYTDMARGIARVFGYDLLKNFNTPYLAKSITEFWRKWHISLSSWIKDYLYIPLGGNRKGEVRTYLNIMLVFILCGLWHGAGWNFIIWGAIHGVMLSIHKFSQSLKIIKISLPKIISIAITYFLVCVSWIFFRSSNLDDAFYIIRYSLVGLKNFYNPNYIWSTLNQLFNTNKFEMLLVFVLIFIAFSIEYVSQRKDSDTFLQKQNWLIRWSLYTAAVSAIILLRNSEITQFIYVQF